MRITIPYPACIFNHRLPCIYILPISRRFGCIVVFQDDYKVLSAIPADLDIGMGNSSGNRVTVADRPDLPIHPANATEPGPRSQGQHLPKLPDGAFELAPYMSLFLLVPHGTEVLAGSPQESPSTTPKHARMGYTTRTIAGRCICRRVISVEIRHMEVVSVSFDRGYLQMSVKCYRQNVTNDARNCLRDHFRDTTSNGRLNAIYHVIEVDNSIGLTAAYTGRHQRQVFRRPLGGAVIMTRRSPEVSHPEARKDCSRCAVPAHDIPPNRTDQRHGYEFFCLALFGSPTGLYPRSCDSINTTRTARTAVSR
jgi:hypothetical protein